MKCKTYFLEKSLTIKELIITTADDTDFFSEKIGFDI